MLLRKTFSLAAAAFAGALLISAPQVMAAGGHDAPVPAKLDWSFSGAFGKFDQAQVQRGFRVYREVCSTCHSINKLSFRNLGEPGGPEFNESQIKALAAEYKVKDGPNDKGEMFERTGRGSDIFPPMFANKEAAISALGAYPPDMSVLAKARTYSRGFPLFLVDAIPGFSYQEHGPDYIVALLNGYSNDKDPNYNDYFPGNKISMAKPLSDGAVEYTDGTPKTAVQYSKDVTAFLMWVAEPKLEARKKTGFRVMAFLAIFASLLYFTKKKVWAKIAH
jgi:ubiquinol-cytochrome c reductase cytochrome c1 subunit